MVAKYFVAKLVDLVGKAPSMQQLYRRIEKIAGTEATVLISGESGTGKELVARAVHRLSRRSAGEFVAVNCAAVPEGLMEAEFFGAEKGAYTGAHAARAGRFEAAHGGTLFLDEIGELPLAIQPKLLRALQEGVVTRIGGQRELRTDVRLVAATNRALPAEVAAGRFREDLYYRLKVVTLLVPPLRERKDDIPLLVERFVRDFNLRQGAQVSGVTPALLDRLMAHDWPGNIRELRNVVDSMAVLATERVLDVCDADESGFVVGGAASQASAEVTISPSATLDQAERLLIAARLRTLGSRAEVARSLGIGLRTLYTKLRAYGLAN